MTTTPVMKELMSQCMTRIPYTKYRFLKHEKLQLRNLKKNSGTVAISLVKSMIPTRIAKSLVSFGSNIVCSPTQPATLMKEAFKLLI